MNATIEIKGIKVNMDGECLGIMGPSDNRTVVRKTTDNRFVVMTAAKPYRVIKAFADSMHARRYNAAIHGETI